MDRWHELMKYGKRAKRSLNVENMLPLLQYGVFFSLVSSLAILIVSRFFVFAYYDEAALAAACATLLLTAGYIWFKRIRLKDALRKLDSFYPYNELVTALSYQEDEHPLAKSMMEKAIKESAGAFERFQKRPKTYWRPKALFGILISSILAVLFIVFPSETQREAQVVEKEREAIQEMKNEVAKLEKKAQSDDAKKEMNELLEKLKKAETSEQALREIVKKQKELKLQEQKLLEKRLSDNGEGGELTEEELKKLQDLQELQHSLAKQAEGAKSYLSKLGKPLSFDLQNTISKMVEDSSANSTEWKSNQNGNSQSSNGNQENPSSNENQRQNQGTDGKNQGNTGSGTNQNQGNADSGTIQGQGSGGQRNGQGQGNGSLGGTGAGIGMGGRTLLSIPMERLGEKGEPTIDSGPLGEGNPAEEQKGPVPVAKGEVRPYEEVIGQYEERFMQSTKRLQLPKDLQNVVESYFSSIQSDK